MTLYVARCDILFQFNCVKSLETETLNITVQKPLLSIARVITEDQKLNGKKFRNKGAYLVPTSQVSKVIFKFVINAQGVVAFRGTNVSSKLCISSNNFDFPKRYVVTATQSVWNKGTTFYF